MEWQVVECAGAVVVVAECETLREALAFLDANYDCALGDKDTGVDILHWGSSEW